MKARAVLGQQQEGQRGRSRVDNGKGARGEVAGATVRPPPDAGLDRARLKDQMGSESLRTELTAACPLSSAYFFYAELRKGYRLALRCG